MWNDILVIYNSTKLGSKKKKKKKILRIGKARKEFCPSKAVATEKS